MRSNPIRKRRARFVPSFEVPAGRRIAVQIASGFWYAICPSCGEVVRGPGEWGRPGSFTRKQAKDALYRHEKNEHGGPGGDRPGSDAEAAQHSSRVGRAADLGSPA